MKLMQAADQSIIQEIVTTLRESIVGIFRSFFDFLPDLFIGLVILLIGWVIAKLLKRGVIALCSRIGVDQTVERLGLAGGLRRANIKQGPSELIGIVLYWTVFLNFLLEALNRMNFGDAVRPLQVFIDNVPTYIAALITFVLGTLLAQFIGTAVSGALSGVGLDFHEALGNAVRLLVMCMVIIIVVGQIGLPNDILVAVFTNSLTIIIAGIALSFGLGGRSITRNVLAGFYARDMFTLGDVLEVNGQQGSLEGIGSLSAEILTADGTITIPNTHLTEGIVKKVG